MQKGRYYGACQRRDERCKNRKYKYIREDVVQEVVKQELERLLCPSQSILEWVVESMQSDVEKAADNRAEVEQNTKARIERIKSMDEALYDDKLAGVITQERYEAKHESFMNEIETLELAMASFDSTVTERKRRGIYMLELSQRAAKYYDEKDDDEKRQILIELFENIMFKNDAVSVSLKDRAELIAKYSSKTRELLGTRKSNDRTFTNSDNNRGQNNEKSAENALYPLWQGTWNTPSFRRSLQSQLSRLAPHVRTHDLAPASCRDRGSISGKPMQRKKSCMNARLFSLAVPIGRA